jgi:hypothetical protein
MSSKHKSCKSKTRSGRRCSRLCKKEGMCSQHHRIFLEGNPSKERNSSKSRGSKSSINPKVYVYYTRDNGGRPFKVEISENNTVSIYAQDMEEQEKTIFEENPFKIYNPEKIFIGKSILNKMTEFSGARDDPKRDGNSILLEMNSKKLEYIHIGATVYSFTAYDKIREYVSPVGNSGVPYPYAIDELGNYYLMIEDIVLENNDKIKKAIQDKSKIKGPKNKIKNPEFPFNPYTYYYGNTEMHGFENYEGLKIGNQNYFFAFNIEDLDSKKKRFDNAEVILIKKDGSEEVMNKESYKALMDRFAKSKGFKNFINKIVIHERMW